ncbi:hypothetical protein [Uliginosibacterium sp. 31-12]|uniref:hypothetical protein n=1 Tax=Uliginosibacterium sp. 31-12 TaxID=3062781 RepID=UPI0026E1C663|nr:hypothetical protein [Uliginosibacterium sp. 31-12]MDO6388465.1 hypothetical protein [Uliginosibacterium sp. 31-12]
MLKKIIKYAVVAILAFATYKALGLYLLYTNSKKMVFECGATREAMNDLKKRKAPNWEVERFMHEKFSCLTQKQNFLEKLVFPVPDNWINPPPGSVSYDKIPGND